MQTLKETLNASSEEKNKLITLAKKKWRDYGSSLKSVIAKYTFNRKLEILAQNLENGIKIATGFGQGDAKKLVYFITNNPCALCVTSKQILQFYDEYLKEDSNISLELKLILAQKELKNYPSILKYLKIEWPIDHDKDILLKEFIQMMKELLELPKSSSEFIYNEIIGFNKNKIQPKLLEFYCLILNERDKDKVKEEELNSKLIFAKISSFLKKKYKGSKTPLTDLGNEHDFNFSSKGYDSTLHDYDFIEIVCDSSEIITAREALWLFDDIKESHKIEGNIVSGKTIFEYFQEKEKQRIYNRPKISVQNLTDGLIEDDPNKQSKPHSDSMASLIERESNIFLAEWFNFIEKSMTLNFQKVYKILENLYK